MTRRAKPASAARAHTARRSGARTAKAGGARRARASAQSPATADLIVASARELLEAEGPEAVSMRRIARTLGVTPMALYHHFPNRAALLQRIVDEEFAKLGQLADRLAASHSGKLDLVRAVDAYLDYAFARPRMFDYVFNTAHPGARRFPEDFRARRSPTLTPVADEVQRAMESGELRKDDVWEVAFQLWAHAHGFVTLYRAGRFNLDEARFRALYHRAVRRLLNGIKRPAA